MMFRWGILVHTLLVKKRKASQNSESTHVALILFGGQISCRDTHTWKSQIFLYMLSSIIQSFTATELFTAYRHDAQEGK